MIHSTDTPISAGNRQRKTDDLAARVGTPDEANGRCQPDGPIACT